MSHVPDHVSRQHSIAGRLGAHVSWANTVDRTARTAQARRSGPSSLQWHLDRLHPSFEGAREVDRIAAATSARSAYFARLALKSAQARKREALTVVVNTKCDDDEIACPRCRMLLGDEHVGACNDCGALAQLGWQHLCRGCAGAD
jgi:hypothetical protein